MVLIPGHILDLAPYKPGRPAANMFGELRPKQEVILASNENNFGPSPLAAGAIRNASGKVYLYPDPTAATLKEKLGEHLGIPLDQIAVSNGSDALLLAMFRAFIPAGKSMLTSHAAFVSAKVFARMNNVPCVEIPMKTGYAFDLDRIADSIDNTTQLIYLVNPNNPTGAMISAGDLEAFLNRVPDHILVVIDEAYFEFASVLATDYPDASKMGKNNLVVLRTFSKAYGLAGLRLGYAIGPPYLISALNKVKLTFDPNIIAQVAGTAALDDREFLLRTIENNSRELKKLYTAYRRMEIPFIPSFANFITLDLGSEEKVEKMYESLRGNGVLTRRLASFGLPHCLRVSVGLPHENEYYLDQLEDILVKSPLEI